MHTVNIYEGTTRVLQLTRPTFKLAWRAAVRSARTLAAVDPSTAYVVPMYTASRHRVRYQIGAFAVVPERRIRGAAPVQAPADLAAELDAYADGLGTRRLMATLGLDSPEALLEAVAGRGVQLLRLAAARIRLLEAQLR